MPSGICASIDPSEYSEYAIESTTPDFTIVTDEASARRFGLVKSDLERAGTPLSDLDLQIACVALQHNVPLVTHNRRHFERVSGLAIEDWLE